MNPLPIATPEITRFFHTWLETFSGYVREVDYASAKPRQSAGKGVVDRF